MNLGVDVGRSSEVHTKQEERVHVEQLGDQLVRDGKEEESIKGSVINKHSRKLKEGKKA